MQHGNTVVALFHAHHAFSLLGSELNHPHCTICDDSASTYVIGCLVLHNTVFHGQSCMSYRLQVMWLLLQIILRIQRVFSKAVVPFEISSGSSIRLSLWTNH